MWFLFIFDPNLKMARKKGTLNKKRSSLDIHVSDSLCFKTFEEHTTCLICNSDILTNTREGKKRLKAHERTQYHQDNFKLLLARNGATLCHLNNEEIHKRLTKYYVETGIPLTNLDSNSAIKFYQDAFGFKSRCSETYRCGFLPDIIKYERARIEKAFFNVPFVIKVDETTDANGKYILNIFGQLLTDEDSNHYLIDTIQLEKCNSANILSELRFLIPNLIKDKEMRHLFKGLVTDGAPYCLKLGQLLKEDYPDSKHGYQEIIAGFFKSGYYLLKIFRKK